MTQTSASSSASSALTRVVIAGGAAVLASVVVLTVLPLSAGSHVPVFVLVVLFPCLIGGVVMWLFLRGRRMTAYLAAGLLAGILGAMVAWLQVRRYAPSPTWSVLLFDGLIWAIGTSAVGLVIRTGAATRT
ncbi:MAG: hypothetical protein ACK5MP_13760 [Nostocoides sp.]